MLWIREHHLTLAVLIALGITAAIAATASPVPAGNDSLYYLNVAEHGLLDNPDLVAPFVYRIGTPLLVRMIHQATSLGTADAFLLVAFLSSWGLLVAAYLIARALKSTIPAALAAMSGVALSFVPVKFSFLFPVMVDVEGILLITLAFRALLRRQYRACLVLTCIGLLFKEFLIIPAALLVVVKAREYVRTKQTRPLAWMLVTLSLAFLFFLGPRIAIPVVGGFGVNRRWDFGGPSHWEYLRNLGFFLSGTLDAGRLVNVCFALSCAWLPVMLLATRARAKKVWEGLASLRLICLAHVAAVVLLTLIGGTNIIVFVAYTAPVMVLVLAAFLRTGVHPAETAVMLTALLIFNRIPFLMGGPDASGDGVIRFYGGWWSVVDGVTVARTLEMAGYLLLVWIVRVIIRRGGAPSMAGPAGELSGEYPASIP